MKMLEEIIVFLNIRPCMIPSLISEPTEKVPGTAAALRAHSRGVGRVDVRRHPTRAHWGHPGVRRAAAPYVSHDGRQDAGCGNWVGTL